jgi:hypothetical protein
MNYCQVLATACGEDAVYATIDAVETFVDRYYRAQIERLAGDNDHAALCDTLRACMDDELAHRDEARSPCWPERSDSASVVVGSNWRFCTRRDHRPTGLKSFTLARLLPPETL